MLVKDYQYIQNIPTGITYELELAKYFKIDITKSVDDVSKEITEMIALKEYKLPEKYITFNNKLWCYEKDILESSFEQWIRLETLTAENDNIKNFHKLLAIYFRPVSISKIFKRKNIEDFNLDKQEAIANELLDLPLEIANALIVFFWSLVPEFMLNMQIHYLNQMNQGVVDYINQK